VPAGEGFFETVLDLPPWHGLWNLVSSQWGQQATGAATIETETLPNGNTAVAAETYENVVPGGVAVTAYTFSRDGYWGAQCNGPCAVTWIPVLTSGPPRWPAASRPRMWASSVAGTDVPGDLQRHAAVSVLLRGGRL